MKKNNSDCFKTKESTTQTKTKTQIQLEKEHESKDSVLFRLYLAVFICVVFMIAEIVGGVISGSISILTDAFHLLSDVLSFCISIFSIHISRLPSSKLHSYGFYRAEVLGALMSMALIWGLTIWIVSEAIGRIISPQDVNGFVMLVTASVGLLANLLMGLILGHSHHHSGHSHGEESEFLEETEIEKNPDEGATKGEVEIKVEGNENENENEEKPLCEGIERNDLRCCHEDSHSLDNTDQPGLSHDHKHDIGLRAAFIHVIGDCVQSIGVIIAGVIIYYYPDFTLIDPICSLLFAVIVLFTTFSVMKDCMRILMEASPKGFDSEKISSALSGLESVIAVHDVHIWSLSAGKVSFSCHLVVSLDSKDILELAVKLLRNKYRITHATIQVETDNPLQKYECENMLHN